MDIDITAIAFQAVNFGIILFVLKKFLLKPILKVLDDRADRIKEGLEAAEKNIKLKEDFEGEKSSLLSNAKKEANKIIADAKKEAEGITREAQEKAKGDAKKALKKEREAFQAHMDKEIKRFKESLAEVVTEATNQVIAGSVDSKMQKSIVEKQIKDLKPALFN